MKIRTQCATATAITLALALAAPLRGSEAVPTTPLRAEINTTVALPEVTGYAVYADTPEITADLEATTIYPTSGTVSYGNCFARAVSLADDGSAIVPKFGGALCGPRIGVAKVKATNANVATFVQFKGARRTGYEIPLLTHAIGSGAGSEVRLVTNPRDGSFGTSLLLFNVSPHPAWVTARIYDDAKPGSYTDEAILTNPSGALTWYDLQIRFESGRIVLIPGLSQLGCYGCSAPAEVYGLAAIGTPGGDAPRVRSVTERVTVPLPPVRVTTNQ